MLSVKVTIEDLEKAMNVLKAESRTDKIDIKIDGRYLYISTFDFNDNEVTVSINADGKMVPLVKRTERLL